MRGQDLRVGHQIMGGTHSTRRIIAIHTFANGDRFIEFANGHSTVIGKDVEVAIKRNGKGEPQ